MVWESGTLCEWCETPCSKPVAAITATEQTGSVPQAGKFKHARTYLLTRTFQRNGSIPVQNTRPYHTWLDRPLGAIFSPLLQCSGRWAHLRSGAREGDDADREAKKQAPARHIIPEIAGCLLFRRRSAASHGQRLHATTTSHIATRRHHTCICGRCRRMIRMRLSCFPGHAGWSHTSFSLMALNRVPFYPSF